MIRLQSLKNPVSPAVNFPKPKWLQAHWLSAAMQYIGVALIVFAVTLVVSHAEPSAGHINLSIVYLFVVLVCAALAQPGVTLFCGLLSFVCYDFFLVPPVFTLRADTPAQLLDPLAFLLVAVVTCIMAERSRRRAMEAAVYAESDRLRTTLLQLVSHNLRTPLATIKTAINSVASSDSIDADSRLLLEQANQESDHLNRLIANVLQLSRLEANVIQVAKEWNALDELVSEVFKRWPAAVADKSLTALLSDDLPLVQFDFALIEAVITNLVDNAFRHGRPPVRVSATLRAAEIWITVEDAGAGIPLSEQDKLFVKFSSATSKGIGLGLALCKGLAEAHGGRLKVEFKPTRFILILPYTENREQEADDDASVDR